MCIGKERPGPGSRDSLACRPVLEDVDAAGTTSPCCVGSCERFDLPAVVEPFTDFERVGIGIFQRVVISNRHRGDTNDLFA